MNIESAREYCMSLKGVTEEFPFDDVTLVFKVMGKMFAIIPLEKPASISLKCDPERAVELREHHSAITPGWHLNKKHWNSVSLLEGLAYDFVQELIKHSYDLVAAGLTKKLKEELNNL